MEALKIFLITFSSMMIWFFVKEAFLYATKTWKHQKKMLEEDKNNIYRG